MQTQIEIQQIQTGVVTVEGKNRSECMLHAMETAHEPAASRGQPMHRPGVTVAARLRPLSQLERDKGVSVPWRVDSVGSRLQLAGGGGGAAPGALPRFDFDHVYDSDTTQHAIYEDLGRPLVQHAFAGGTAVLFAHGASGSGKTHALTGETLNPGIATVSYTHLRAHETDSYLVCRLLLEKKKR